MHACVQVLNMDPAGSREARYSMHDFLSMYERIALYQVRGRAVHASMSGPSMQCVA
jgi:hypothetical protein